MSDNYCWSLGPRIGNDGRPVCFRERGHKGMHESHPDSGFVDVTWSGPDMPVAESVRGEFWTPDSVATTDPAVEAPMASDPTALIREADEALDGIVTGVWPPLLDGYEWQGDANFIAAALDLVRRLRDALEASDAELDGVGQALALAEIRVNHFRAYAEDVAAHGMRADLNPTLGRVMTADETVGWAYSYLRRVDAWVRGAANRTLDTDPGDSGLPPLPPEHRFLNLNPYSQKPSDTEAALAEANATIERVKALADDGQTVGWVERDGDVAWIAADAIRRAIEGPAT